MQYNQIFKEELSKLNLRQKEAVDNIEGPVLVVAGPGTGKTHILSARIGQILTLTDTQPHSILCLTYTDAGVFAMRNRLLDFIGPDAYKVHINTFHSFCNHIIQDHTEVFGQRDVEPISDLEKVEFIREIIDEFPNTHALKILKGDPYLYESKLKGLFQLMKAEYWTPEYIIENIDKYLKSLPTREDYIYKINSKNFKKGDLKASKLKQETEKMERLRQAVELFPKYQAILERHRRYDFEDMIQWIINAFEANEDLLRTYQEQYLYILVDEFQDTNGAQSKILQLLADYWENPNIFVVGDDDQSIFEFQGARVKNILDFYEWYKDVELIVLENNYRSTQPILDAAKTLINHNQLRLVNNIDAIEKNLKSSNKEVLKLKTKPEIVAYYNSHHEETGIVHQIEELIAKGVHLSEIAIIYRNHKQAENIVKLLEKKTIAYQTKRRINIQTLPIIRNQITLLKYIQKEIEKPFSGEKLLYEILHFDFLNLPANDIARISFHIQYQNKKQDKKGLTHWRRLIGNYKKLKAIGIENPKPFLAISDLINRTIEEYHNYSLPLLFEKLLNRSGLLHFMVKHEEKLWLMQVITTFFEFIKKETNRNPKIKIKDFLEIIGRMEANRLPIFVLKILYAEEGVQLVTAHSSKGLEFEHVFMLGCTVDLWEPSQTNRFHFSLPDTLTLSQSVAEDSKEAARRLFYVAMTRAKKSLIISYSKQTLEGKPKTKSVFVEEVLKQADLMIKEKQLSNELLLASQFLYLTEHPKPVLEHPLTTEELNALLEDFTLSATSLSRFLDCRLSFYFESVLKVPSVSSEAAAFGSAVHNALEKVFIEMKASKENLFPTMTFFMTQFEKELQRLRHYLTEAQYQKRLAFGHQILPDYYRARIPAWSKNAEPEREFRNVEVEGVPLTGIVDKIEFIKNTLRVVDYKTGKFRKPKIERPTEKHPNGGDYWRQVVFYKIMLENYRHYNWMVTSGTIEYIEPYRNEYIQRNISIQPNDVEIVKNQIKSTYKSIMNHDFFTGCGKPNCHWCSLVNEHKIADRYVSTIGEELDE